MRYSATNLVSAPSIEPITTAEARRHLRLDSAVGEPAPTAPTVALAGAGSGSVNNGAHSYAVTFVTADGETERGDTSSSVTTTSLDGKVSISAIPFPDITLAVTGSTKYLLCACFKLYLL